MGVRFHKRAAFWLLITSICNKNQKLKCGVPLKDKLKTIFYFAIGFISKYLNYNFLRQQFFDIWHYDAKN